MKQIIFAAMLAGALFLSQAADAQSRGKGHHGHHGRKKSQQERIQDGVRNGSITRHEAMRLNMQQAKLRGYRQMAKVDGRVNSKERRLLRGEIQRADKNIYRSKHNNNFRRGNGSMAFKGQGAQGRGQFRGGNFGNKGQGFQRRDFRADGRDFHKGKGQYNYKGKGAGYGHGRGGNKGEATWQFRDDNKEGSWEVK